MDWIRKKYWKKSLRYPWPWKSPVKVTFHFLHKRKLEMAFQRHWCAKNGKNSAKNPHSIFDLEIKIFKVKGVCGNSGWLMPCNFFGYFWSEACGSEVRSIIAEFWPAHSSFARFSPLWLFYVPKIEETHERKAFCHDWGDKNRTTERA